MIAPYDWQNLFHSFDRELIDIKNTVDKHDGEIVNVLKLILDLFPARRSTEMKNDPIGDELRKIREEFEKLVSNTQTKNDDTETTPEQVAKIFGLTITQAKTWLEREPNYNDNRRIFTEKTDRRRLYRTI